MRVGSYKIEKRIVMDTKKAIMKDRDCDLFNEYTIEIIMNIKEIKDNALYVFIYNKLVKSYNKGRRKGHNKAVELCRNALNGLENSNSNLY